MMDLKEQYLCSALDRFKEMITHGECSKTDIAYFWNLSQYELDRRGASIHKKRWLTKKKVCNELGISTSTFDRLVLKGNVPRGKKILHKKTLMWKQEEIEQLKRLTLFKASH